MKKSERFSVMVRIEETNEREEARKYSEFRKAIQDKKTKLAELEQYLDEYKERFLSLTRFGAQAEQIKSCYAFIRQLNGAIAQQQKRVLDAESSEEEYRQHWLQAKRRMDVLRKAVNKFRLEELQHERRKEQTITDEIARRKYREY